MNSISFIACGLIACILIVVVKQYKPEFAVLLSIASACVMLFLYLNYFSDFLLEFNRLLNGLGAAQKYLKPMLKVLGLCVITQLSADICRDAGQQSVAARVELGGKLACLVATLPIFNEILDLTAKLLG